MVGYVALGSNVGDRRSHLERAVRAMSEHSIEVDALSSVWESEPVDCPTGGPFLNLVARIRTDLGPRACLERLLEIEREMGRERAYRNAPRTIDLDLLVLGGARWSDDVLTLPHPRMWWRRFVLAPLAELAPDLANPSTGQTVSDRLDALSVAGDAIQRVGRLSPGSARPYNREFPAEESPNE